MMLGLVDVVTRIETERLVPRQPTPADTAGLARTMDDVMLASNGWTAKHAADLLGRPARLAAMDRMYPDTVIASRTSGEILGHTMCGNIDVDERSCEIGWWVGPAARGRGYGTEAVTALVGALHGVGFRRIWIGTATDNVAVQRTAATIGARLVRQERRHKLPNGRVVPSLWFAHDG
jgi:RimJ/RimL family protein N-acetyltransferase